MRDSIISLKKEKLHFEGHYEFINKRSKTDAPMYITERVRDACYKGYYACGAFLNFGKAFNTVNYETLLNKLKQE